MQKEMNVCSDVKQEECLLSNHSVRGPVKVSWLGRSLSTDASLEISFDREIHLDSYIHLTVGTLFFP